MDLNKLVRTLKSEAVLDKNHWFLPTLDGDGELWSHVVTDAGDEENSRLYNGCWMSGQAVTLGAGDKLRSHFGSRFADADA